MTVEHTQKQRFERLFADVYEPLQKYITRRVEPASVDDVLSETLLVAWRRLDQVPEGSALPWCYGVARRVISNHRRSKSRRLRLAEKARSEFAIQDNSTPVGEDSDLEAAFGRLEPPEQEVLRLWAWEQLEPRQIALILETTPNAVSSRLKRAKQKLERELERQKSTPSGHRNDINNPDPDSGAR